MKSMFKKIFAQYFSSILIGFTVLIVLLTTGWMIRSISDNIEEFSMINAPSEPTLDNAIAAAIGEQFTVKEYDGRIGIFLPGDTQPSQVIQIYVTYLPEADRARLKEGIEISGRDALISLIDDLRS